MSRTGIISIFCIFDFLLSSIGFAFVMVINFSKFLLLVSVLGFSQEKNKIEKMGLYSTTTINLGLDLVQMIADKGKSDAANMLRLSDIELILTKAVEIDKLIKGE